MKNIIEKYYWPIITIVLVVLLNVASQYLYTKIDLTEEKRFSLTSATEQTIESVQGPIFIQILLQGEFPAGFRRLQDGVKEMLTSFKRLNPKISFRFEDPLIGDREEVKQKLESWAQVGIVPTDLNVRNQSGESSRQIFPYAIFNYGDRQVAINLLERESPGVPPEIALNNSISLLEYKFANAIAKLQAASKPNILFTEGHGELSKLQTAALEGNLRAFYNTGRINLDSIYKIPEEISMLIIAKPTSSFSDKSLFKIDQFIMNGGRLLFLIDPLVVNLDSIRRHGEYVPYDVDLRLDELLFKYGARIQQNLVLDRECSMIPIAIDQPGGKSRYEQFPWYYHLLALGDLQHPITKGLDRVNLLFPASIDTIMTKADLKKTPLLRSSPASRKQFAPVILDLGIINRADPSQFVGPPETLALLIEGVFSSAFENRTTQQMRKTLTDIGASFKTTSDPTKILIVADGDIAKNLINPSTGEISDLGFNKYMNYTFANKNFLTNAIEFMLDNRGLIDARAKTLKLRLLNKQKMSDEKLKWQFINVALPLILLIVIGWIFQYLRRRKYGVPTS